MLPQTLSFSSMFFVSLSLLYFWQDCFLFGTLLVSGFLFVIDHYNLDQSVLSHYVH